MPETSGNPGQDMGHYKVMLQHLEKHLGPLVGGRYETLKVERFHNGKPMAWSKACVEIYVERIVTFYRQDGGLNDTYEVSYWNNDRYADLYWQRKQLKISRPLFFKHIDLEWKAVGEL